MTDYIQDSVECLNSLEESGRSFSDLFSMIGNKDSNSSASFYPDIVLATTDVLATFSPMARSCFYTSMEAKNDFKAYTGRFDSFSDWMTQFGTNSLANYFDLKEMFNTIEFDISQGNKALASFHIGEFLYKLIDFEPAPQPEPEPESLAFNLDREIEEAKDRVNSDFEGKAVRYNNIYEGVYTFLTSLNAVNGIHLDSCKYYASGISENIYKGSRMI